MFIVFGACSNSLCIQCLLDCHTFCSYIFCPCPTWFVKSVQQCISLWPFGSLLAYQDDWIALSCIEFILEGSKTPSQQLKFKYQQDRQRHTQHNMYDVKNRREKKYNPIWNASKCAWKEIGSKITQLNYSTVGVILNLIIHSN